MAAAKVKLSSEKSVLGNFTALQDLMTSKRLLCDVTKSYLGRKPFTVQGGPTQESEKFSGRGGGVPGQSLAGHAESGVASGSPSGYTSSPQQAKFSSHPQSKLSLLKICS